MGKVIPFNRKRKDSSAPVEIAGSFMGMVEKDTNDLALAIGKTSEEAIEMASDFYRKYPMLVEYVRSPEFLLRGK